MSDTISLLPENWRPEKIATLVYVLRDGKVLLIEKLRGHGAGKVNAPGGHLEVGETTEECASRELFEESHVAALNLEERANLKFFDVSNGFSMQGFVYVTESSSGVPVATDEAIPFWISISNIPYERMWEDDYIWLPRVLNGDYISGEFIFSNDELKRWRISSS